MIDVTLTVNGSLSSIKVDPRKTAADVLREDLGLTGTHLGCEHGACGACTILVDGATSRSCLMLAGQLDGADVMTIEGLAPEGDLHPLQHALRDRHAFQCGFCTPGFVMAAVEMLRENPTPTEAEVREAIAGNVCRCTGYQSIIEGILLAAERGSAFTPSADPGEDRR